MRFLGHVPLVRLAAVGEQLELRTGALRQVPFQEWRSMDGAIDRRSNYDRTAPVFYEITLPAPAADGEDSAATFRQGRDAGSVAQRVLHRALLLVSTFRIPEPELSVAYLVVDGAAQPGEARDATSRMAHVRHGPCDRELVVFGEHHRGHVVLDGSHVGPVDDMHALLTIAGESFEPLLSALVRTTRPGFTAMNEALHLVAGLEALLVRRSEPLTATFARRFGVLAADDDPHQYGALGRALYALRSDLVHGRPLGGANVEGRDEFLEDDLRALTCVMAERALRWFAHMPGESVGTFHDALDAASRHSAAFSQLHGMFSAGSE